MGQEQQGHHPADAALGLEGSYTPALARLMFLEGADASTYLQAERHLEQAGGISVTARRIQRLVQRVGGAAQQWQERPARPAECERCDAPIVYVSAHGTGAPMVSAALAGRKGKQADGKAKTRQAYLGCVFTQHRVDAEGHPVRDWNSTTCVSGFMPSDEFGLWSEPGAENILALRCINRSARLDQFWEHRLNVHAATKDVLPLKAAA